jgi:hypothetical protein
MSTAVWNSMHLFQHFITVIPVCPVLKYKNWHISTFSFCLNLMAPLPWCLRFYELRSMITLSVPPTIRLSSAVNIRTGHERSSKALTILQNPPLEVRFDCKFFLFHLHTHSPGSLPGSTSRRIPGIMLYPITSGISFHAPRNPSL